MNLILFCLIGTLLLVIAFMAKGRVVQFQISKALKRGDYEVSADIDAIRVKPYAFRLQNQIHVIKPMDVVRFSEVSKSAARLDALKDVKKIKEGDLLAAYTELFQAACPSVTRSMIEKMSIPQVGQLANTIIEYLVGKAHVEAEKKNLRSNERLTSDLA